MAGPIYTNDGESTSDWLLKLLVAKQQQEVQKEQLGLRKKELEQQAQEYQQKQAMQEAETARQQGPMLAAQSALQAMLQQAAAPAMAQYNPMNGQMMGAPQMGEPAPQAAQQYGQLAQQVSPQQALGAAPTFAARAQAQQEEKKAERALTNMKNVLTPDEYSRLRAGLELKMQLGDAMPTDALKPFIPETALEAAQRADMITERVSNEDAQKYLASKGIHVGADGANAMLQTLHLNDRRFAQSRELTRMANDRADARALLSRATDIEKGLRSDFQNSQVTKASQTMAKEYSRILKHASAKTGVSDEALVFAFVHMQDQTAARDAEREAIKSSGSIYNYISAKFGKWAKGTKLSDDVRQQLVAAAGDMLTSQKGSQDAYSTFVRKNATESGIDPTRVLYDPFSEVITQAEDEINSTNLDRIMRERSKKR
jgi:hypothetical protein